MSKKAKGFFGTILQVGSAGVIGTKTANAITDAGKKVLTGRNIAAVSAAPFTGGASLAVIDWNAVGKGARLLVQRAVQPAKAQGYIEDSNSAAGAMYDGVTYYAPLQQGPTAFSGDNPTLLYQGNRGLDAITQGAK